MGTAEALTLQEEKCQLLNFGGRREGAPTIPFLHWQPHVPRQERLPSFAWTSKEGLVAKCLHVLSSCWAGGPWSGPVLPWQRLARALLGVLSPTCGSRDAVFLLCNLRSCDRSRPRARQSCIWSTLGGSHTNIFGMIVVKSPAGEGTGPAEWLPVTAVSVSALELGWTESSSWFSLWSRPTLDLTSLPDGWLGGG